MMSPPSLAMFFSLVCLPVTPVSCIVLLLGLPAFHPCVTVSGDVLRLGLPVLSPLCLVMFFSWACLPVTPVSVYVFSPWVACMLPLCLVMFFSLACLHVSPVSGNVLLLGLPACYPCVL